ncbi:phosphate regulon sensor histidine kinase PhoR [Azohydromonas caseinilytica]|uniref:Phosphate regulon sensor protein PhoR n=1 Tax=Azohydromonas caseinilytica TaxID=2728836 RepID=A0A848FJ77_9BURK|nr:phosphate regulon sensor histidine kinase PhoR [Azohydromonas caseinilytica]NML18293.1 phosphate regulon sensor histidine kinase PhoR [Azohydromonas caseinilytica]
MRHLFGRPLAAVAAWAAGSGTGALIGATLGETLPGLALGGGAGVLLLASQDALRAQRLMRWLRRTPEKAVPRDPGFWGELGYCVERALRERERQLAQERAQHAQFLNAIEASPNGVLLLDAGDAIVWCNPAAADHFGLDPEGDRQQRITNLVRAPGFVALLHAEPVPAQPCLLSDLRRPGTLSVLLQRYGPDMRLVLSQDVTEREHHEAMRRDFVANVSHEIRTPLTALSGFVETLQTLPLSEAERRRVLALMDQQTSRMRSLVDDLLTLARLEGSPRPACDGWFALDPLLEQIEARTRSISGGRHAIEFPEPGGLELAGNEGEIDSAVTNLLSNAVRYTPPGGGISVMLRRLGDGRLEIGVRDSGIGIAREHLPRLAERFYRVDGSRSRDTGGTGLGLSIVKHVASRHGGELSIASSPGKGSTFTLQLPAARVRQGGRGASLRRVHANAA